MNILPRMWGLWYKLFVQGCSHKLLCSSMHGQASARAAIVTALLDTQGTLGIVTEGLSNIRGDLDRLETQVAILTANLRDALGSV